MAGHIKYVNSKQRKRFRRKIAIRLRMSGTAERPRLSVFRSARYVYAQAVDDTTGRVLACASELEAALDVADVGLTHRRIGRNEIPVAGERGDGDPAFAKRSQSVGGGARILEALVQEIASELHGPEAEAFECSGEVVPLAAMEVVGERSEARPLAIDQPGEHGSRVAEISRDEWGRGGRRLEREPTRRSGSRREPERTPRSRRGPVPDARRQAAPACPSRARAGRAGRASGARSAGRARDESDLRDRSSSRRRGSRRAWRAP